MKYELDPEEKLLAETYLKLRDIDVTLGGPYGTDIRLTNDELRAIDDKITDAYLDLFEYLIEKLGDNETMDLLDRTAMMRTGTWKEMFDTDIRPEDGEEVLIADDEIGFVFYAQYDKKDDSFHELKYFPDGYSVLGSKKGQKYHKTITHYMPLPDPPTKRDRLPLNKKEKSDAI